MMLQHRFQGRHALQLGGYCSLKALQFTGRVLHHPHRLGSADQRRQRIHVDTQRSSPQADGFKRGCATPTEGVHDQISPSTERRDEIAGDLGNELRGIGMDVVRQEAGVVLLEGPIDGRQLRKSCRGHP